jgi:hypothetical protein
MVAGTIPELEDTRVPSWSLGVRRSDLDEKTLECGFAIHASCHVTAIGNRVLSSLGNKWLNNPPKLLRTLKRRYNTPMLEELSRKTPKKSLPLRRVAVQFAMRQTMSHD